jgi:hypothetical protein
MGAGHQLGGLGLGAVPGDQAVMSVVEAYDLGATCASPASDFAPEVECRSRYRATDIGLIAYTR